MSNPQGSYYVPLHKKVQEDLNQLMMQLMSKLNANVEKLTVHQKDLGKSVAFPAQPEQNPRGQNYNSSTSGSGHHEQAKAVTILRSGRVIEKEKRVEEEKEEQREEDDGTSDKPGKEEISRKESREE